MLDNTRRLFSQPELSQVETRYEEENHVLWCYMKPTPRPCFNSTLLDELRAVQRQVALAAQPGQQPPIDYFVFASALPGVFNLGGDLALFKQLIEQRDGQRLRAYAKACIDAVYHQAVNLQRPLTTIALVQGDALGGGFEAALSCSVLIAEKQAQFGLPEVLFNLFPGMGAYQLLSRRLDPVRAERLITSGRLYSAEELFAMGIIDELAEPGEGELAVQRYLRRRHKAQNTYLAMQRVRERCHPIDYQELLAVSEIWVDTVLSLGSKDIKMMDRLVRAQNRRESAPTAVTSAPVAYSVSNRRLPAPV